MELNVWICILAIFCAHVIAQDSFIEANLDVSPFDFEVDICGESFMTAPSGRFTSPLFPANYPADMLCEWVIEVEAGNIVEIKFDNFQVGEPGGEMTDYIMIFEEDIDGDGEYFFGSNTGATMKYRSKTNFVIVQFLSDEFNNFKGFNATYNSWNAVNFCDRNMLGPQADLEKTKCRDGINNDFYKRCYVACQPNYVLEKSSRVDCQNGKFMPEKSCQLVAWEAQLCEITNFAYCIYNAGELADFWLGKESRYLGNVETESEDFDLDIFPDPAATELQSGRSTPGDESTTAGGVAAVCFDKLIGFEYCKKKKNSDNYAFNCKAFLKVKKLKKDVRQRKMETCFRCRTDDCKNKVVVDQYI
uniref:uncharacterized protein LOC120336807 isoform X1 n=2 Tax=Styela clava TaxID=7725 RepID=UPI00193ABA7C|nr:uncharacterized protein LOC120336807 isoform X1 [Styela clava]